MTANETESARGNAAGAIVQFDFAFSLRASKKRFAAS